MSSLNFWTWAWAEEGGIGARELTPPSTPRPNTSLFPCILIRVHIFQDDITVYSPPRPFPSCSNLSYWSAQLQNMIFFPKRRNLFIQQIKKKSGESPCLNYWCTGNFWYFWLLDAAWYLHSWSLITDQVYFITAEKRGRKQSLTCREHIKKPPSLPCPPFIFSYVHCTTVSFASP